MIGSKSTQDSEYKITQQLYSGLKLKADFAEKDVTKLTDDAVSVGLEQEAMLLERGLRRIRSTCNDLISTWAQIMMSHQPTSQPSAVHVSQFKGNIYLSVPKFTGDADCIDFYTFKNLKL